MLYYIKQNNKHIIDVYTTLLICYITGYIKKNNKHIIDVYTTLLICYIILSKITST